MHANETSRRRAIGYFCVPQEIVSKIQQRLPGIQSGEAPTISVSDILAWVVTETWNDTRLVAKVFYFPLACIRDKNCLTDIS